MVEKFISGYYQILKNLLLEVARGTLEENISI